MRAWFGARVAYALWLIPPLAAAMTFAPARIETVTLPAAHSLSAPALVTPLGASAPPPAPTGTPVIDLPVFLVLLWAGGVLLSIAVLALRQHRFLKALGRLTARGDWGERVYAAETTSAVTGITGPNGMVNGAGPVRLSASTDPQVQE